MDSHDFYDSQTFPLSTSSPDFGYVRVSSVHCELPQLNVGAFPLQLSSDYLLVDMPNPQDFKDKAVGRMIGRKPMPTGPAARDPRRDGIKNPANAGEQKTRLEQRVTGTMGTRGPRPSGYKQQSGPGMLPR